MSLNRPANSEVRPEFRLIQTDVEEELIRQANLGDEYAKMLASPAWLDFKARIANRINSLDQSRDDATHFRVWRALSLEMNILRSYIAEPQRILRQARSAKVRLADIMKLKEEEGNG